MQCSKNLHASPTPQPRSGPKRRSNLLYIFPNIIVSYFKSFSILSWKNAYLGKPRSLGVGLYPITAKMIQRDLQSYSKKQDNLDL